MTQRFPQQSLEGTRANSTLEFVREPLSLEVLP
jgi:hypothetical protein